MPADAPITLQPAAPWERKLAAVAAFITPTRVRTYPAAVGAAVLVMWIGSLTLGPGITDVTSNIIGGDFAAFYTAGRFYLDGRTAELYDLVAQRDYQAELVAPAITMEIHPYVNPPFTVLMYAPFAIPGYLTALTWWWSAALAAMLISLKSLRRELLPAGTISLWRLTAAAFLFFPTIMCFVYGQNTALTLLLYAMGYVWLRRGWDGKAGFALGLLFYKPQLMIAVGIVLLVKGRWKALAGVAAGVATWSTLGFLILPESMAEYAAISPKLFNFLRGTTETFGLETNYPSWGLHSFFGFSLLLLDGISMQAANVLAIALSGGSALAVALAWRRTAWNAGSKQWDLMMAATLAIGLLISPHLFMYDLMLLVLPMFIVIAVLWRRGSDVLLDGGPVLATTGLLYAACFVSSIIAKIMWDISQGLGLPRFSIQISIFAVVAWVWCVYRKAHTPSDAGNVAA